MKNRYLIYLIFFSALFIPAKFGFYFFPAAILYFTCLNINLFKFVRKFSFIVFVIVLIILQPMIADNRDNIILGIKFSLSGFHNGLMMILRAVVMISSISYLSNTADRKKLQNLFSRVGVKHFDKIFEHTQEIFPLLKEKITEFYKTINRRNLFNPVELSAHFLAFLIRATYSQQNKNKGETAT